MGVVCLCQSIECMGIRFGIKPKGVTVFNTVFFLNRGSGWIAALCLLYLSAAPVIGQEIWTLESSMRHVLEVAPEVRAVDAGIRVQDSVLKQAGAWPNPEVGLRVDGKIGKDEGRSGLDLTQLTFSQPLPLGGRLGRERKVASAKLRGAQAERLTQRLELEFQVAGISHPLQLAIATLYLAEQQLQFADCRMDVGRQRTLAGGLFRLEQLRIGLIRESAKQALNEVIDK